MMRFFVIAILSCQQYLAISMIYAAVPIVLRQNGAPLELIGLFGFVFFGFTINFLWAPVVDRRSLNQLGLRRSWIFVMQLCSAFVVVAIGLLDPARDFNAMLGTCVALAMLGATQRIATLGYVAEALSADERPFGTALVGWGAAVGNVVGGAVCLHLITSIGWRATLLGLAALLVILTAGILLVREPVAADPRPAAPNVRWARFLRTPALWTTALVISPGVFGVAVAFAMATPRLVDLGLGASEIGWIGAVANIAAFTIVAPLTGFAVACTTPARAVFVGCIVLAICFLALALAERAAMGARMEAIMSVGAVFAALAVQHVAFTTWFVGIAQPGEAATDVTFLTSVMSALAMLGFAASGLIAHLLGYWSTLFVAGVGYLVSACLAKVLSIHASAPTDQAAPATVGRVS